MKMTKEEEEKWWEENDCLNTKIAGSISTRWDVDAAIRKLWLAFEELNRYMPEAITDEDADLWAKITDHKASQVAINKK